MGSPQDPAALAARVERLEGTLLELVTALGMLVSELALREDLELAKPGEVERALERGWTALVEAGAGMPAVSPTPVHARRRGHLYEVTEEVAAVAEIEDVAARVLRQAMETTHAAVGALYHVPANRTESVLVAYEGYPPEVMAGFRVVPHDAPLPVAAVAASGRPLWFEDRSTILESYPHLEGAHERTEAALGRRGVQGAVIPLTVDARVVAVLLVGFTGGGALEAADERVRELAEASARALAEAEGSQDERRVAERLRRESAG